ncbi:MAG: transketolase C-terminal domain-containing protein, partial [Nitrospirota bacterium]
MVVMAPKDGNELGQMLKTALSHDGPSAIRYPRGSVTDGQGEAEINSIPLGKAEVIKEGTDILIIAIGSSVLPAVAAAEQIEKSGVSACVVNARFVKPLDISLISRLAKEIKTILTVEENTVSGGFGSAVLEELNKAGVEGLKIKMLGIPDRFIEQGTQSILRKKLGLDAEGIAKEALALIDN